MKPLLLFGGMAFTSTMMVVLSPHTIHGDDVFGHSVQVSDDGYERSHHDLYSSAQRVLAVMGDSVFLVWSDDRSGDRDIFFSSSNDRGASWTSNTRVNDDLMGDGTDQRNPTIVVDAAGIIYLVWADARDGHHRIYSSRSIDGGLTFEANVAVQGPLEAESKQSFPALAIDGRGTLYVAWKEENAGELQGRFSGSVYLARSTDGGKTWTEKVAVDDSSAAVGAQQNPSVIVDDSGIVYVAWMDTRRGNPDVWFSRSLDGGFTWMESVWVTDSFSAGAWEFHPSLGVDAAGNLYIAYTHGVYDIYVARSLNSGLDWHQTRVNNTSRRFVANLNPSLAVNADGIVAVVWADTRRSRWAFPPRYQLPGWLKYRDNYDIYAGISVDQGESFRNIRVSDSMARDFEFMPTVALGNDGSVSVAWQGLSQGKNNVFFARAQLAE